jgi:hypothetical protein
MKLSERSGPPENEGPGSAATERRAKTQIKPRRYSTNTKSEILAQDTRRGGKASRRKGALDALAAEPTR